MTETPNYELQLRRLRITARRVLKLNPSDPGHPEELAAIKDSLLEALNDVASKRKEREHLLVDSRVKAKEASERKYAARVALLMREVSVIEHEAGHMMTAYELVPLLNKRGNIEPPRGFEWNEGTVRKALRFAGRT